MLTVDSAVSIIDEELTLLRELRRFAANPNALALMQRLVANGTSTTAPSAVLVKRDEQPRRERHSQPKRHSGEPTGLKAAALQACLSFGDKKFVTRDVLQRMLDQGYKFKNSNPRVATSTALQSFTKAGNLELVKRGVGSDPSEYRNSRQRSPDNLMEASRIVQE